MNMRIDTNNILCAVAHWAQRLLLLDGLADSILDAVSSFPRFVLVVEFTVEDESEVMERAAKEVQS